MPIWNDITRLVLRASAKSEVPVKTELGDAELVAVKRTLERILCENIAPFWYPASIDSVAGGYRLNHDIHGNWRGPANKQIIAQARMLYFFSRLAASPYGSEKYLEASRHGYEFLRRRMWDQDFRGFYWETDSVGKKATKPNKHLCGQAYALFAISEYFQATTDPSAKELCDELFEVCEEYAHDVQYGGYRELFEPNWLLAAGDGREYMGAPASVKLLATHLHLLEALTSYSRISKNPVVKERLTELILVLVSALAQKSFGVCTEKYDRNWRPLQRTEPNLLWPFAQNDLDRGGRMRRCSQA